MSEPRITAGAVAELIGVMKSDDYDGARLLELPDTLNVVRRLETVMDLLWTALVDTGDAQLTATKALDKYLKEWHE